MAIQWLEIPYQYLQEGKYDQVVQFYESLLEENPEIFDHYCHLGLAYLLAGKEEEAQLTWFTAFNEIPEDEIDNYTEILIEILSQEGDRQLAINNYQLAWLIRSHIKELTPDDFDNLLQLICLDIKINNSDIERFETWQLEEVCQSISGDSISTETLVKGINVILCLPCPDSLAFARLCLNKKDDFDFILAIIVNFAVKMAYNHRYASYAADLLKICLEFQPSNLSILNALHVFSSEAQDYENAIITGKKFLQNSHILAQQIFGLYEIIHTCLQCHDWQELKLFFPQYIKLVNQYIAQPEEIDINFIRQSLPIVNQSLFYVQDNPEQNRYIINNTGKIFQSLFRKDTAASVKPYTNLLTRDRPLKIGYIASTFRSHSVGWLCRWLIHYHDQEKYPCYIYGIMTYSDEITEEWFKKKVAKFHSFDRNIENVIEQIQKDEIDILVDLESLTLDLVCQIMALKPAPIQVTWLGLDASGIPAIDYFIADPYVLPDHAQDYYSEKIWRLPNTYLGVDGFEVGVPTLKREDLDIPPDVIIFLNVQNKQKLHPDTIRLQMKIIKAVPNSYLLIKERNTKKMAQQFFEQFAQEEGVEFERLRFLTPNKTELEHRANLAIADVILDTYPYNGSTTTLETLWMEIPLVTRVGEQFAARNSYTYMMNAGITEGIAWSNDEYIEWGIKLGTNENLRKQISWKLRQSKKTSPLWNGKQFTREMENAYRQMWEIYVKENS